MMPVDYSHVDDNNNDGTSTCHLTRFNRCCDPTTKLVLISRDPNKRLQQADTIQKQKGDSLKSSQTNGNCFTASGKPTKADALECEHLGIIEKAISELETSLDELEDSTSSSEKENKSTLRDQTKSAPIRILRKQTSLRGILKYPPGWRRRAVSECSALVYSENSFSDDSAFYGTSLDSQDNLFEFLDQDRPKKNVSFSDKMATFVFRPNSSILGRRLKNQKKAKRRKDKKLNSLESIPNEADESLLQFQPKDEVEAAKHFIELQRMPFTDSFDSTSDVSSSGCECSTSECSGDEAPPEVTSQYQAESKDYKTNSKTKRKNRRKRNRKNKQEVRLSLETGGYDSD